MISLIQQALRLKEISFDKLSKLITSYLEVVWIWEKPTEVQSPYEIPKIMNGYDQ